MQAYNAHLLPLCCGANKAGSTDADWPAMVLCCSPAASDEVARSCTSACCMLQSSAAGGAPAAAAARPRPSCVFGVGWQAAPHANPVVRTLLLVGGGGRAE
jgi:hypothetical protein